MSVADSIKAFVRPSYHRLKSRTLGWELRRRAHNAAPQNAATAPAPIYPRKIITDTSKWAAKQNQESRFVPIVPETRLFFPSPKTIGRAQTESQIAETLDQAFVIESRNARAFGESGDVLTQDGNFLADLSAWRRDQLYLEKHWHPLLCGQPVRAAQSLGGTTCLLASLWASHNYFHWLCNALPRIELMKQAGNALDTIDHFLVNAIQFDVQWESLDALGIPRSKIIQADASQYFQVERLLATSSLIPSGHMNPWVHTFLRKTFLPDTSKANANKKRLFISRGDAKLRRLMNEDQLVQSLERFGFERVLLLGKSIREQAEIFAHADAIVLTNGAAATNIIFCEPGTRILALHSPSQDSAYSRQMAGCAKLDYYYVQGHAIKPAAGQAETYDYRIDAAQLEELVRLAKLD